MRLRIPGFAKRAAENALSNRENLPKSQRFGMSKLEAKAEGITSGVSRAEQLVSSKAVSLEDACSIGSFYTRFKNCKTTKCEGAIDLWGGRRFGQMAAAHCKKHRRQSP